MFNKRTILYIFKNIYIIYLHNNRKSINLKKEIIGSISVITNGKLRDLKGQFYEKRRFPRPSTVTCQKIEHFSRYEKNP